MKTMMSRVGVLADKRSALALYIIVKLYKPEMKRSRTFLQWDHTHALCSVLVKLVYVL